MAVLKRIALKTGVAVVSFLLFRTGDAVQMATALALVLGLAAYILVFQPHKDTI